MTDLFGPLLETGAFKYASFGVGVIGLLIVVGMLVWLYRDADDRKSKPVMWVVGGALVAVAGAVAGMVVGGGAGFAPVGLLAMTLVVCVLLVYRVVRPTDLADDALERELAMKLLRVELATMSCPKCDGPIESDYILCPSCGIELRRPCGFCGRPVKPSWAACPYCGARKGA